MLLLLVLLPSPAEARIYRQQLPDGSVLFTDRPPPGAGEAVQLQGIGNRIDTAVSQRLQRSYEAEQRARLVSEAAYRRWQQHQRQLVLARHNVAAAEQALQAGKVIIAGDTISTANGGTRQSPAYHQRIASLKQALAQARARLAELQ